MGFVTVADAKASGLIPEKYHSIFYEKCKVCNSDMVISDTLTVLQCGNPRCFTRLAGQMQGMLSDLGVKGWGTIKCLDYIRDNKFDSIIEVLIDPPGEFRNIKELIASFNFTYTQLIQLLHIPWLGTKLTDLLQGINSYDELIDAAAKHGSLYEFCRMRLGGEAVPQRVAEAIETYSVEFQYMEQMVAPVKQAKRQLKIAITGYITQVTDSNGGKLTKEAYIHCLNDIARESGLEIIKSDAVASVAFIVADYEASTSKYLTGKERGCLITSSGLMEAVRGLSEKYLDSKEPNEVQKTATFNT
ncbi:MAG: hypothetical protein RSC68_00130 [Acinetobacter sp.]